MEYDPSRRNNPLKHREFLNTVANFKDVLPIRDDALRDKIKQTYRMQVSVCYVVYTLIDSR